MYSSKKFIVKFIVVLVICMASLSLVYSDSTGKTTLTEKEKKILSSAIAALAKTDALIALNKEMKNSIIKLESDWKLLLEKNSLVEEELTKAKLTIDENIKADLVNKEIIANLNKEIKSSKAKNLNFAIAVIILSISTAALLIILVWNYVKLIISYGKRGIRNAN